MKRREAVAAGLAVLAAPRLAFAQSRMAVVGVLGNDATKPSPHIEVLAGALRESGFEAGKNLRIVDAMSSEGYGAMEGNAAALVRAKVDVIVSFGATATTAVFKVTREIPVVAIMGSDPVVSGFAKSLARPSGNVTGISTLVAGLIGKEFDLLRQLVPGLSRVGYLLAGGAARTALNLQEARSMAQELKLQLEAVEVRAAEEIEAAIAAMVKAKVGAVRVAGNTLLSANAARIVSAIGQHRLPGLYTVERFADAGGLMVYGPSTRKAFAKAATYVERILKGAKPGDLPIEQMRDLELIVNLKTARAQGIKVSESILLRADRVIE